MPSLPVVTAQIARAIFRGLADSNNSIGRRLLILGGFTASGLRLAVSTSITRLGPRPEKPMILWDFERCRFSRSVREALSSLDLDAEIRPCPLGGSRFRGELGGGGVPRLEDPNTGRILQDSRQIVKYLHDTYGTGRAPWLINTGPFRFVSGLGIRLLTGNRGGRARPSKAPEKPLELWSFEASPYSRFARATLSELELPYLLHNISKDSPRRPAFIAMSGKMQAPYLHDPNTGVKMFESLAIERYLEATYGTR